MKQAISGGNSRTSPVGLEKGPSIRRETYNRTSLPEITWPLMELGNSPDQLGDIALNSIRDEHFYSSQRFICVEHLIHNPFPTSGKKKETLQSRY